MNETYDELLKIFDANSTIRTDFQDELSYRQMLALVENMIGWSMDARCTPEQTARWLGLAKGMEDLAWIVGPDWAPPEPPRLSAMGFAGRMVEASLEDIEL